MGGLASRNKGKRGEREVIGILQPVVTSIYEEFGLKVPTLKRDTRQSDGGGYDISGIDWLAIEVKYQQAEKLNAWWQQTLDQCGQHQCPVLFYRRNKADWSVRMFATLHVGDHMQTVPVSITVPEFLRWFRARLHLELTNAHS
jgi:hypothetical protein